MILETRVGIYGITSHAIAVGYKSLEQTAIWRWDPNELNHRMLADEFWIYGNTLW
jgi:hypothetical protein